MVRLHNGEGAGSRNPKRLRNDCQPQTNHGEEIKVESANECNNEESSADIVVPCGNGPLPLILANPNVLDCSMCKCPLTTPVFQCDNGHLTCSFCCTTLDRNRCYSCGSPIGSSRCRAIEKVLESVKVKCHNSSYGCKESVTYSNIRDHQNYECLYEQCICPISDCYFVGASNRLYQHFSVMHNNSAVKFLYNNPFEITLNVNDKFFILQEEKDEGVLFVLNNSTDSLGNLISVSCIASKKNEFCYNILVSQITGTTLRFQSFAHCSQMRYDKPLTSFGFVLVPSYFFSSNRQLRLKICIRGPGATPDD